jgi:hypothetical protein
VFDRLPHAAGGMALGAAGCVRDALPPSFLQVVVLRTFPQRTGSSGNTRCARPPWLMVVLRTFPQRTGSTRAARQPSVAGLRTCPHDGRRRVSGVEVTTGGRQEIEYLVLTARPDARAKS